MLENVTVYQKVVVPMPKQDVDQNAPQEPEELSVESFTQQLKEQLQHVDATKLAQARESVRDLVQGDLQWAELLEWTPEKLHEAAKVAYAQFEASQYSNAELIFKGLTVLDPINFYYHLMLGACFQQQNKYPEALVEYSLSLDLNPQEISTFTNRGEVYFQLKLFDLADKDFDAAIALDPKSEDRWANRARLLKKKLTAIRQTQQSIAVSAAAVAKPAPKSTPPKPGAR